MTQKNRRGFTDTLLMIRPAHFGFNSETAINNVFQTKPTIAETVITAKAIAEFDQFVEKLRSEKIEVEVWQDDGQEVRPDAIFPNNWISFHEDGTIITYPMYAENRRKERDGNLVSSMSQKFNMPNRVELESRELNEEFLEGTGSMVLDRENQICYACISPRTNRTLLEKWCDLMDYDCVAFEAVDDNGGQIYHTNVMMAIGPELVVICTDSISDPEEWKMLKESFDGTNKEVLEISFSQMTDYAGNMLFVRNSEGKPYVVVSTRAWNSLSSDQKKILESHAKIIAGDISTIETIGGGSVRCMLAEVFSATA